MKPEIKILAKNRKNGSFEQQKQNNLNSENVVYLDDNENFEIQIFNPFEESISVSITLNNKAMDNRLIIKPGQKSTIERHLDTKTKFLFKTYEVEANNKKVDNAIKNNGSIKFSFYKEKKLEILYGNGGYLTYDKPITLINNNSNHFDYGNSTFTSGTYYTNKCLYNTNTNGSINIEKSNNDVNRKETGRIEEGGYSNQEFGFYDGSFSNEKFYDWSIRLCPKSSKPKDEIVKNYCCSCGYRLRNKNWCFCPKCGSKV